MHQRICDDRRHKLMEVNMPCDRCRGLRVPEMVQDGGMRVMVYRCLLCGDVIDPKILLHRLQPTRPGRARTTTFGSNRWGRKKSALT